MRSEGSDGRNTLKTVSWRTQKSKAAEEVPKTNIYQDGMDIMHQWTCTSIVFFHFNPNCPFVYRHSECQHSDIEVSFWLIIDSPNVWGQREAMAEIHYNIYLGELRCLRKQRKYLKQIHIKCNIQNHIWGCHVQYTGTLDPSQYLSTSYDTGTRPRTLQRWIEPQYTIMVSLQRSGSRGHKWSIILCNLVHRWGTKVFINNPKEPVQSKPCEEI